MPAIENFPVTSDQPFFSARRAWAITKSNDDELAYVTKGLYVGGSGDVAVRMYDGTDVTFVNVAAGTVLPVMVKRVLSTGTDATDIVGLA